MASHLTLEERDRIASLRHQGAAQKEIARAVGRACSAICRELLRNDTGDEYLASQAQRRAEYRRRERTLERKSDRKSSSVRLPQHARFYEYSDNKAGSR